MMRLPSLSRRGVESYQREIAYRNAQGSTGALTAPFAFLGSAYDPQLTQVYTAITAKDVLRERDVFAYPPAFNLRPLGQAQGITRIRKLYVIRNARLDPDWLQVRRQTLSIAKRAISTLIQSQGIGDLYRMYAVALRDGVDFNLANIPSTFTQTLSVPFDKTYMNALFRVGYDAAKGGYPWSKLPPGFNAIEQESAPSAPVT